jgi:hypothetical protein
MIKDDLKKYLNDNIICGRPMKIIRYFPIKITDDDIDELNGEWSLASWDYKNKLVKESRPQYEDDGDDDYCIDTKTNKRYDNILLMVEEIAERLIKESEERAKKTDEARSRKT